MMGFKRNRGFTIIELLIAMAVIVILAAVIIVSYNSITTRTYTSTLKNDLLGVAQKLDTYKADNSSFPNALTDLKTGEPKTSEGLSYTYQYDSPSKTYCLSATSNRSGIGTYKVTNDGTIASGTCTYPTPVYSPATYSETSSICTLGTSSYSHSFAATGTAITYSLQSGSLPSGFSLNTSTGVVSGTITTTATSNFVIAATNSGGSSTITVTLTLATTACP